MSYDVSLTINTGRNPVEVCSINITSNVAPMWRHAGANLADMDGWPATRAAPVIAEAIARMEADPAAYEALNPANGWGDSDGCLTFLREIHAACLAHPRCALEVSH